MRRRRRTVGPGDPAPRLRPFGTWVTRRTGTAMAGPSRRHRHAARTGRPDWPVREPLRLVADGAAAGTVSRLLDRMRASAFQGRQLGEAFGAWKRMIDGDGLIAIGLAGSMASAGLWPLIVWLVERGYVDLVVSTSANATEDLLEQRGVRLLQVDPDHVDDEALRRQGFYRFYDHVVSAAEYDAMEDFTSGFFEHLADTWPRPTITGVRFMRELGRWLDGRGSAALSRPRASATACRSSCRRRRTVRSPRAIARPGGRGPSSTSSATTRSRWTS